MSNKSAGSSLGALLLNDTLHPMAKQVWLARADIRDDLQVQY
jgi:hypothetical protein